MAKKKMTRQENQAENNTKPQQEATTMAAIDEASSEKLQSLKSLNSRLVKEAFERREEVASLIQAKGSLESELTRANSEKENVMSELTQLSEEAVRLDVERAVVFEFVDVLSGQQAESVDRERSEFKREKEEIEKEMKRLVKEINQISSEKSVLEKVKSDKDSEIVVLNEKMNGLLSEVDKEKKLLIQTSEERDELMMKLDVLTKEAKVFQVKLTESENIEKGVKKEIEELAVKYNSVVEEKDESEKRIESIMMEKDTIEKSLSEANRVIEEMKGNIEMINTEKEGIEDERNLEKLMRSELENAVNRLNESVLSFNDEKERLLSNIAELEKKKIEYLEKEKQMIKEIDGLDTEKKEMEKKFEMLVEEKGIIEKDLDKISNQFNDQKMKIEGLVIENNVLVEDKERKEIEILELQKKVKEYEDVIQEVKDLCKVQMEKVEKLESEIVYYKGEIKQVGFERDEARKDYEEVKLALKKKIEEMENCIEKNMESLKKMEGEKISITEEKEELGKQCEILKKEINSTENTLAKVKKEFDELRSKVDLENANSVKILKLLKGTTQVVCSNGVDLIEKEMNGDDEIIGEFELIKNAFKSKESKVEEMGRQVNLLTYWSSATTILTAVSLAYIARGH